MKQPEHFPKDSDRREFIGGAAAALAFASRGALAQSASVDHIPIIDAHIHLFDNTRPLGAGYMGSQAYRALSKPSLPSMYSALAQPAGIVGAIVVESSPLIDDNLWYLEECRANPIMVGVCGTLNPAQADFGRYVTHFHRDPLFRAIRASRFYSADQGQVVLQSDQVANLKLLAQADLALDTANPTMDLMRANVLLADAIPDLRIIMDHLPSFDPDNDTDYHAVVKEMADRPNIFVKLTEVYHPRVADGVIVKDYEFLRARLEYLFDAFGEDRVMFGTDYPNSYGVATIPEEVAIMKRFFATKSRQAAEKYFWRNSARIYKWVKQAPDQPSPS
ncbi:MAG: amidohydrolase family protein [Steroidobacteraceae bacterium]|jgi:predicted TIM-barrel fold metal-dependent hydrolase